MILMCIAAGNHQFHQLNCLNVGMLYILSKYIVNNDLSSAMCASFQNGTVCIHSHSQDDSGLKGLTQAKIIKRIVYFILAYINMTI